MKGKLALASIVTATILACSVPKNSIKTQINMQQDSIIRANRTAAEIRQKDSLKMANIIMNYTQDITLYKTADKAYWLHGAKDGTLNIIELYKSELSNKLWSQTPQLSNLDEKLARSIIDVKNNSERDANELVNTIKNLTETHNTYGNDNGHLYKYAVEDFFETELKRFPKESFGGLVLDGEARKYFINCQNAAKKIIAEVSNEGYTKTEIDSIINKMQSAKTEEDRNKINYTSENDRLERLNRLNYLKDFLSEKLSESQKTADIAPGIYKSRGILPENIRKEYLKQLPKDIAQKIVSDSFKVDIIVVVTEYYHNIGQSGTGNIGRKYEAHKAAAVKLSKKASEFASGKININLPFEPYDDREIPKGIVETSSRNRVVRVEELATYYEKRKAVIKYYSFGDYNLTRKIIESSPYCKMINH